MAHPQVPPEPGVVDRPNRVGIIGGTGALGGGLALRWSMAGIEVRLGSRDGSRAKDRASALVERLKDRPGVGAITGETNRAVAASESLLVLAVPMAGLDTALASVADLLDDRLLICAVAPVGFDERGPFDRGPALASSPGASVAESVADAVPRAKVVAAFHTVSSEELAAVTRPMDDDLPIAGDHDDACSVVAQLANAIDGCRGVPVGRLRLASSLEALTPVLIAVNQRASARVGMRFSRLPPETGPNRAG
jgi:8-hydroxy-5-deazaflavin:NADPH oxidoreductase